MTSSQAEPITVISLLGWDPSKPPCDETDRHNTEAPEVENEAMKPMFHNLVYPLTSFEPRPFFTGPARDDLHARHCVLCHQPLERSKVNYCLVGRRARTTDPDRAFWSPMSASSQEAYQAAYVGVCPRCTRHYYLKIGLRWACQTGFYLLCLLTLLSLALRILPSLTNGNATLEYIGDHPRLYLFAAGYFLFTVFLLNQLFDCHSISHRVIQTNEFFPIQGVRHLRRLHLHAIVNALQLEYVLAEANARHRSYQVT